MTSFWEKSSNLSEKFRLTILTSQSVERFGLGRKTKIQIFTTYLTFTLIQPSFQIRETLKNGIIQIIHASLFYLLQFLREHGQLGVLGRVATKIVSSTEEELAMLTHSLWKQSVLEMNETWHHAQEISATVSKNLISIFLFYSLNPTTNYESEFLWIFWPIRINCTCLVSLIFFSKNRGP